MYMLLHENVYGNQARTYIKLKNKITNLNVKLDFALK